MSLYCTTDGVPMTFQITEAKLDMISTILGL